MQYNSIFLFCKVLKAMKCPVLLRAVVALFSAGLSPDRIQDLNKIFCFWKSKIQFEDTSALHTPHLLLCEILILISRC